MYSKYKELIVAIVVALIGLFSGLTGVYVGSSINANSAKELASYSYQNELLQQRIKLLDRAAAIYGKAPGIQDVWKSYLVTNANKTSEKSIELSKILAEYNAEFNAVINLSGIYFGPKTHESLKIMGANESPWWEKNDELVKNYMGSMAAELKYGIE